MQNGEKRSPLNTAQKKAVNHTEGPLLVVAGAGTGKTRVIIERIMHLIETGVNPAHILALTFTEKAAGEMLDRINQERGGFTLDTTIATYNGFGDEILKGYAAEIGLGNFRLLGETGQLVFLREHLDEYDLDYFAPVSRPDSQLKLLSEYISRLKHHLIMPDAYEKFANTLPDKTDNEKFEKNKHQELARFYKSYIHICRINHVIDYDDQLYLTIELLRKRPNLKHELQNKFKYILVDEFQDTNPMQSELLKLLGNDKQNIMVVGDDDQSIYGWRGATLANILTFKKTYPKAAEITLIENYRSTQKILDSAYQLIQYNNPNRLEITNKLDKHLHANIPDGPQPKLMHFSHFESELEWVAKDIASRLRTGQDPNSIAILARRNQGVQRAHEVLELQGIAHAVAGLSNDLYQQIAVNHLIEVLKVINEPSDSMALFHTLGGPLFSISPRDLAELSGNARREHTPLSIIIENSDHEQAQAALGLLENWRSRTHELSVGDLAYQIITESGWKKNLYARAEKDEEVALQVQALSQYFRTLKEFERIADVASLQNYLNNLPTLRSAGNELQDASLEISDTLINVLSIHRAKGLEWDTVYIIDCTEGSFPMRSFGGSLRVPEELTNLSEADDHMAEERRLMYVAATRARQELILTYADIHTSTVKRRPSRFIHELLGDDHHPSVIENEIQQVSMELFAPRISEERLKLPKSMYTEGKLILTVSQIDRWLRCPQDFYYCHVLEMPLPDNPVRAYGTLMHHTIEAIHEARRNGETLQLDTLLEVAKSALPKAGYISVKSRERAHAQALKTVEKLFKRFSLEPMPIEIEKSFRVAVPDSNLMIIGRIDAVYPLGENVEILDYKSGTSVTTPEKARARATSSNQLALYALAWKLMHNEMPALLTLDFVETGIKGSVKKQAKSIDTLTIKLRDMVASLEAGKYVPGKDHTYCHHPI